MGNKEVEYKPLEANGLYKGIKEQLNNAVNGSTLREGVKERD